MSHTTNSNWYKAMQKFNWSVKQLKQAFSAPDVIIRRIHAESPSEEITQQMLDASRQMCEQVGF